MIETASLPPTEHRVTGGTLVSASSELCACESGPGEIDARPGDGMTENVENNKRTREMFPHTGVAARPFHVSGPVSI